MTILKSASRIVFILLTLTACIGFYFGKLDPKDFMLLCSGAFAYYFTQSKTPDSTPSA